VGLTMTCPIRLEKQLIAIRTAWAMCLVMSGGNSVQNLFSKPLVTLSLFCRCLEKFYETPCWENYYYIHGHSESDPVIQLVISWGLEYPPPPLCEKSTDFLDVFTSIDIRPDFGLVKVIIMLHRLESSCANGQAKQPVPLVF